MRSFQKMFNQEILITSLIPINTFQIIIKKKERLTTQCLLEMWGNRSPCTARLIQNSGGIL
jgi:hypothetical protein